MLHNVLYFPQNTTYFIILSFSLLNTFFISHVVEFKYQPRSLKFKYENLCIGVYFIYNLQLYSITLKITLCINTVTARWQTVNGIIQYLSIYVFLLQSKTIREFDSSYTAKQFGYKDVESYYTDATIHDKLHKIEVPLLCLSAGDDPFQPLEGKFQ
jgi:predicted alpha/beta-fold hydrolase